MIWILLAIAVAVPFVVIAIVLVAASRRPADFAVTRSTFVAAPPAAVFPLVNDFRAWDVWSPWAKLDPNSKVSFDGPPAGVGAKFAWSGNNKVGRGRMTITDSVPPERVGIRLEFDRPMRCENVAVFTFAPAAGGTDVTWSMTGRKNLMMKAAGLFMDMDKMVGADFEKGLAAIKAQAEATPTT